jgi:hypothetical protein
MFSLAVRCNPTAGVRVTCARRAASALLTERPNKSRATILQTLNALSYIKIYLEMGRGENALAGKQGLYGS